MALVAVSYLLTLLVAGAVVVYVVVVHRALPGLLITLLAGSPAASVHRGVAVSRRTWAESPSVRAQTRRDGND